MFNLNYYFVDAGENYCTIAEYNLMVSLRDAILENNLAQLKLIKEYIKQSFKKKCIFSPIEEFKIVLVNKVDKMTIESAVEDIDTLVAKEPLFSNSIYDAYVMTEGQALSIKYRVVPNQVEHRYLRYEYIKSPTKQKKKF